MTNVRMCDLAYYFNIDDFIFMTKDEHMEIRYKVQVLNKYWKLY